MLNGREHLLIGFESLIGMGMQEEYVKNNKAYVVEGVIKVPLFPRI